MSRSNRPSLTMSKWLTLVWRGEHGVMTLIMTYMSLWVIKQLRHGVTRCDKLHIIMTSDILSINCDVIRWLKFNSYHSICSNHQWFASAGISISCPKVSCHKLLTSRPQLDDVHCVRAFVTVRWPVFADVIIANVIVFCRAFHVIPIFDVGIVAQSV